MELDTQTNATKCIKLAATLFAPDVARWYWTEYARIIKPSPVTWEFFVQCVIDKYEPVPIGFTARTALKSIRQTGTIEEYNAAFNEVITRIDDMSEADKVDKYIDGLKQASTRQSRQYADDDVARVHDRRRSARSRMGDYERQDYSSRIQP